MDHCRIVRGANPFLWGPELLQRVESHRGAPFVVDLEHLEQLQIVVLLIATAHRPLQTHVGAARAAITNAEIEAAVIDPRTVPFVPHPDGVLVVESNARFPRATEAGVEHARGQKDVPPCNQRAGIDLVHVHEGYVAFFRPVNYRLAALLQFVCFRWFGAIFGSHDEIVAGVVDVAKI